MKAQWNKSAPFVDLDLAKIDPTTKKVYDSFISYVKNLDDAVSNKIPVILHRAEILPREAEEVQNSAADEIERLDFMKKPQALVAIAYNIKELGGIPALIKKTLDTLTK